MTHKYSTTAAATFVLLVLIMPSKYETSVVHLPCIGCIDLVTLAYSKYVDSCGLGA